MAEQATRSMELMTEWGQGLRGRCNPTAAIPYSLPEKFKPTTTSSHLLPEKGRVGHAKDDWVSLALSNDVIAEENDCYEWEGGRRRGSHDDSNDDDDEYDKRRLMTEIGGKFEQQQPVLHLRCLAIHHLEHFDRIGGPLVKVKLSVPHDLLIKDLSLLMTGIESNTFPFCDKEQRFRMAPGVTPANVSPEVWRSFASQFLACGDVTRTMHRVVGGSDVISGKDSSSGAIYKSFVRGIKNFLRVHGAACSRLAEKWNRSLFQFTQSASRLVVQVQFVSQLCGGGGSGINTKDASRKAASKAAFDVPRGLALIGHILKQTRHVGQQDLNLITISILNATLKPYFRFLSSWLFEGKCVASDSEFGVVLNANFIQAKDVNFWTHGFSQNAPPADDVTGSLMTSSTALDLISLTRTILSCGKSLNLLRLCQQSEHCHILLMPNSSKQISHPKLKFVISPSQERQLRDEFEEYNQSLSQKISDSKREAEELKVKQLEEERMEAARSRQEAETRFLAAVAASADVKSKRSQPAVVETQDWAGKFENSKKQEVAGKIGQLESNEGDADKSKEADEENQRRIEAVKKDLQKFYGVDEADSTSAVDNTVPNSSQEKSEASTKKKTGATSLDQGSSAVPLEQGAAKTVDQTADHSTKKTGAKSLDQGSSVVSSERSPPVKTADDFTKKTGAKSLETPVKNGANSSEETVKLRRASKSERCTPVRDSSVTDSSPSPRSIRSLRKKSADDLVRASHPIFKVPDAIAARKRKSMPVIEPVQLPSVDQIVRIADARTLPYALTSQAALFPFEKSVVAGDGAETDELDSESAGTFVPLDLMLKHSLEIPLRTQFRLVSQQLLEFFFDGGGGEKSNLWKNLEAVRNYLLLKDSEFAHNLCLGLVHASSGGHRKTSFSGHSTSFSGHVATGALSPPALSRILQEAIGGSVRASADPFSDHLGFALSLEGEPVAAGSGGTGSLALSLSVSWPLNIVLTDDLMKGYQKVFRLMLHLEKTYLTIQETFLLLRKPHRKLASDTKYKEIQLIRHGMLNYLLTLRGYLRGQILDKLWLHFQRDVDRYVVCLDSLRTVHGFYVDKVVSNAFQKKEMAPIRETIYKTLDAVANFCCVVTSLEISTEEVRGGIVLDGGGSTGDVYKLAMKEANTFNACLNFLISVVSKLDVRGHKLHMQELLVCLKNSAMTSSSTN